MEAFYDSVERFFDGMGLMTGDYAVQKRMVVGALAGAFLVTYFKPKLMFENGRPRPWQLLVRLQGYESDVTPTAVPWFAIPFLGAFIGGVLI